jgi:hypothetical protein
MASGSITKERWQEAQQAERKEHTFDYQEGFDHYRTSYEHVFRFLGMATDQRGKTILEIGPADFPALAYCQNYKGIIVEPMPSKHLNRFVKESKIKLIHYPVEEIELPFVDEAWLFNVLQHVIYPDLFIEKCKGVSKVIRYFEPIDYPTSEYHAHTFTRVDFVEWFGLVNIYEGGSVEGFHQADCAYGTWQA